MKVRLTCTGTRPLLMHNERLASPLDSYARRLRELTAKRNKTEEQLWEIARVEFEAGMYFDDQFGPCLPGSLLRKSLIDGARLMKAGRKIERGVVIADFMLPLVYEGPRDIDGLWGGGKSPFVDMRSVRVGAARVDRCRPIFHKWLIEAEVIADPGVIGLETFTEAARMAGEFEGIGDYREMYGRYSVRVEVL